MSRYAWQLLMCLAISASFGSGAGGADETPAGAMPPVKVVRLPEGGLQPQALADKTGTHVVYFQGDPKAGDLMYARLDTVSLKFGKPIRVNSQSGSAVAVGNIRGAHVALGDNGRVHVAWMGSQKAEPKAPLGGTPFLYARLNDAGTAFEPQRNLIELAEGLDGGGSVAARGQMVYVFWHAGPHTKDGEARRRVWMRVSTNGGKSFAPGEIPTSDAATGVCGCCGMRGYVLASGIPAALYRSATDRVHRDTYLAFTPPGAKGVRSIKLHDWRVNLCPMSSFAITQLGEQTLAAWETDGQVYFARLDLAQDDPLVLPPQAVPGVGDRRKHPVLAVNGRTFVVAWTEGMAWNRGGTLAWQLYGPDNKPIGARGRANGVPTWSLVAVVADADRFVIIY